MNNQLYIHIGIAKAASTYLQENIFPNVGYYYLPRQVDIYSEEIFNKVEMMRKTNNVIFSNEGLYSPRNIPMDNTKVLNLKEMYGDPKIIIILRNHLDLLASRFLYKTTVSPSINVTTERKFILHYLKNEHMRIMFYRLISLLYKKFGAENVCVLFFEDLVNNELYFIKKLMEFIGYEHEIVYSKKSRNVSFKKNYQIWANIAFNNLTLLPASLLMKSKILNEKKYHIYRKKIIYKIKKKYFLPFMKYLDYGKEYFLSDDTKDIISRTYSEDNRALQKLLPEVNLEKMGYLMKKY